MEHGDVRVTRRVRMRLLGSVAVILTLLAAGCGAAETVEPVPGDLTGGGTLSAVVMWQPNDEPDLAGYRLYYGTASRSYVRQIDVGDRTSHVITGLRPGTYYFAVTAYDRAGNESSFSDEVSRALE